MEKVRLEGESEIGKSQTGRGVKLEESDWEGESEIGKSQTGRGERDWKIQTGKGQKRVILITLIT